MNILLIFFFPCLNHRLTTRCVLSGTLFLMTTYTGYLGWQWRTIRTLATEIRWALVMTLLLCLRPFHSDPVGTPVGETGRRSTPHVGVDG
jgi:hypothetical protein